MTSFLGCLVWSARKAFDFSIDDVQPLWVRIAIAVASLFAFALVGRFA